ncbi:MAG: hypothetical protein A2751_04765 [Candidatus Doudnabacteria bacterium RIFCSPHIGHO2_01_FULL_46_14]|uniref:Uncharacterized protein n=1 Tax=Candidatus Doudnabacteria bacterium RIFCSPHIGHO2_01_FULL_46_14 TaxID=1817824 RepID=A0A1F5NP22_9BACT|nr:MAG: hypothetical protein A2751_04765 [Candidatus Doudnabacteria bacterium RIFCSPHIGHO2_01_FULL_46_14]
MNNDRLKKIEELKKWVENADPRTSQGHVGLLNTEATLLLSEAVELLQEEIPQSVEQIGNTIEDATRKSIEANRKLAESNNRYSNVIIILTIVLSLAAILQAVSEFAQWKVQKEANQIQIEERGKNNS